MKTTKSVEEKRFDSAVSQARKLLKQLVAGDESVFFKVCKAVDRAEYNVRFIEDARREECSELAASLRKQISTAVDAGREARISARNQELRELNETIKAKQPLPGTWEHELAVARATGRL